MTMIRSVFAISAFSWLSGVEGFSSSRLAPFHARNHPMREWSTWTRFNAASSLSSLDEQVEEPVEESLKEESFDWNKQWYPVLPLSSISDFTSPIAITILDHELVLWKNSHGKWIMFEDACPHRRAPLSTGKISNDSLVCRFHGWEFAEGGACTKIPMMPDERPLDAFCATSYQTQQAGGLLWVFMDPTVSSPPPIPPESLLDDSDNVSLIVREETVSYLSMIENAFDPSHAPFTHDGVMGFSPKTAIPMETYDLVQGLSPEGFEMQHSPYQQTPVGADASSDNTSIMTKRQFIPPCTTWVTSSTFSSMVYTCPVTPGTSRTLVSFSLPSNNSNKLVKLAKRIVPSKIQTLAQDCIHFVFQVSPFSYRFAAQDRITMQGQDSQKLRDGRWDDVYPAPSDKGVSALQKWMRRYGKGGPFSVPASLESKGRVLSIWDSHAKHCGECQRMLRRFKSLEQNAKRLARISFLASVVGAINTVAMSMRKTVVSKRAALSLVLLVLSVGLHNVAAFSRRVRERVFNSGSDPDTKMMKIYED